MKDVKVQWRQSKGPSASYSGNSPSFCWLNPVKSGGYEQISSWHTCRETFTGAVRNTVSNSSIGDKVYLKGTCFAIEQRWNVKYLEAFNEQKKISDDGIKAVLNLMNIVEARLGWGLTRVYKHDAKNLTKIGCIVYVFRGSVKWMRSTQLLSMYLLFARLFRAPEVFAEFKELNQIKKIGREAKPTAYKSRGSRTSSDVATFKTVTRNLDVIIDNVNKLFFKRTLKQNHTENNQYWGISALMAKQPIASIPIKTAWKEIRNSK